MPLRQRLVIARGVTACGDKSGQREMRDERAMMRRYQDDAERGYVVCAIIVVIIR